MFHHVNQLPDGDPYKPVFTTIIWILCALMVGQWILLVHHWVVIVLKWWIYKVIVRYLEAAEVTSEETTSNLTESKELLTLIKTWYELNRIQTSNQRAIKDEVKNEIQQAQQSTVSMVKEIPKETAREVERVIEHRASSESGVNLPVVHPPKESGT